MNINGRDTGFVYTIGVMCTLADYVQANPDVPGIRAVIFTAIEMSKAYCEIHGGEPLTEKEILALPGNRFKELEETVLAVQKADSEPSIETEPVKEKGKKKRQRRKTKLNRAWYLFYGRKLGMSGREVMLTPVGEMMDMISCLAVYNGTANEKEKKKKWTFDEVMALR